jgi:hypothetical protein
MDIPAFGTSSFAILASYIGIGLLMLSALIVMVGTMADGYTERSQRISGRIMGGGGAVAALGGVAIVIVMPIAVIGTFFYTPPVVPVPASTVTLSERDGRDTQRFEIVCSGRTGEVEIVGNQSEGTFTAGAYRFRAERGDIAEPARFSVGLRWENKGWGSRFGGQPSWQENVVSGGSGIRADGTWQAGYLDRPIILSAGSEYVLRVNLGDGYCPHLIALR